MDIKYLTAALAAHGTNKLYAKPLAENDNSKQQIYLGKGFDVIKHIPFGDITPDTAPKHPNFKARLNFFWFDGKSIEQAKHAQLILYPEYPEVRLSGFLKGCSSAPSMLMRPTPITLRKNNNESDGRVLFFGTSNEGKIISYLSEAGSKLSIEFDEKAKSGQYQKIGVIYEILDDDVVDKISSLTAELTKIHNDGWHKSIRLNTSGQPIAYKATNGGGYTLEALLKIIPNGRSEPDYMGWELKSYSGDRITLMTPEPDSGFYGEQGVERFLRNYGYQRDEDTLYFTGIHKVGSKNKRTEYTLVLSGFDPTSQKIIDVHGGIELLNNENFCLAKWSYSFLIKHWSRKHENAAYVKYERKEDCGSYFYRYLSPIHLGIGTSFERYLTSMAAGNIYYDPAPKLTGLRDVRTRVKARSQFRVSVKNLPELYDSFSDVEL